MMKEVTNKNVQAHDSLRDALKVAMCKGSCLIQQMGLQRMPALLGVENSHMTPCRWPK